MMRTKLYSPMKLGDIEVKNRIFLAPLTRNRATPDGIPSEFSAKYYEQRSSGGLLITEATQVSPMGKGYINTPGIHSEEQIKKWKETTDAVHKKGSKIVLQLWHVGRISHTSLLPNGVSPLAPSAIRAATQTFTATGPTDVSQPVAMTDAQIQSTVAEFKRGAENAKKAGFDGVEVHGANGYLVDQFLQDQTNKRTDQYGGTIENRMRLMTQILDAVIPIWGAGQVGIRLSPSGKFNDIGDSNPEKTFSAVIEKLNEYKLAYMHMIERFPGIESTNEELQILKRLRQKWKGSYIANGDYHADTAEETVESGAADAIAFGRTFLANPDLPERLKTRAQLNTPDHTTFYGGTEKGYTDYPYLS